MATMELPAGRGAGRRRRMPFLAAAARTAADGIIVLVVYLGCMLWTVRLSFTSSHAAADARLRRARAIHAPVRQRALARLGREHRRLRRAVHRSAPRPRLPAGGADRPAGPRRGRLPHDLPLSVRDVLRRHRPRLAVVAQPHPRHPEVVRDLGFESFTFDWLVNQRHGRSTRSSSPASGTPRAWSWRSCWRACAASTTICGRRPRVDGIPTWRVYLSIVLPLLRADSSPRPCCSSIRSVAALRPGRRDDHGGPGIASEVPAKFVMDHLFERHNIGLATAAATMMLITVRLPCSRPGSTRRNVPAAGGGAHDRRARARRADAPRQPHRRAASASTPSWSLRPCSSCCRSR